MRRYRRWLPAAVLAAASLTACAGSKNESGNKMNEATAQALEQKQPMDLVFDSSSGDFDKASFMAVFGDKIHEKFPELKAVLADLIDEGELDARLIERLSAP